jgi:hypothetical protein
MKKAFLFFSLVLAALMGTQGHALESKEVTLYYSTPNNPFFYGWKIGTNSMNRGNVLAMSREVAYVLDGLNYDEFHMCTVEINRAPISSNDFVYQIFSIRDCRPRQKK